jgi:hypothetical protein
VRPLLHLLSVALVLPGFVLAFALAVIAIGSTALVFVLTVGHSTAGVGQLPFYVPGLVAAWIGAWLALTERPHPK